MLTFNIRASTNRAQFGALGPRTDFPFTDFLT
jgi:hypothetical protein